MKLHKPVLRSTQKDTVIDYLLMYVSLLCTSGFFFHSTFLAYVAPAIAAALAAVIHGTRMRRNAAFISIIMLANVIFSSAVAVDEIKTIFLASVAVATAALTVATYSKKEYLKCYTNLIYFLCITSIAIYLIELVAGGFVRRFPILDDEGGAYFLGIAFVRPATRWVAMRNQSIFWEPGVFQTFIILAFLFEISRHGENRKSRIAAYISALVTTMSTTGYVALFAVIIIWLLEKNNHKKNKLLSFLISLFVVISLVLLVYEMLPQGLSNRTFDKIFDIINGNSNNVSVRTRVNSVTYSLKAFLASPIWGQGSAGLSKWRNINEAGRNIMVFTPGNWLGRFGLFFGGISLIGFTQLRDSLFEVKISKLIAIATFILIISTEAYTTNTSILTFVLYGWVFSDRQNGEAQKQGWMCGRWPKQIRIQPEEER